MKLLHTADWHVGCKTHGKRDPETGLNTRLLDAVQRVTTIGRRAQKRDVDLVLFAGDAFEHPNPTPTQRRLLADAIQEGFGDTSIVMIPGNHDHPVSEGKSHALDTLRELNQVRIIDEPGVYLVQDPTPPTRDWLLEIQDATALDTPQAVLDETGCESFVLTALPWPLDRFAKNDASVEETYRAYLMSGNHASQKLNVPHYAMGHFTAEGSMPSGSEASLQLGGETTMSPEELAARSDYAALGHIHHRQDLGDSSPVVYPSCPMRKSFSEEGDEKGAVFISDHREPQNYEFIDVEARPFLTIELDLSQSEDFSATDVLRTAAEEAPTENAIVRVRYQTSENQPVDERAVEEVLSDAHKIASIEREVEHDRETRTDGDLGADSSLEDQIEAFCESRGLEDIKDELVETANELRETA